MAFDAKHLEIRSFGVFIYSNSIICFIHPSPSFRVGLFLSADLIGWHTAVPGTFLIHELIAHVGDRSFGFSCRLVRRVVCEPYL